MSAASEQRIQRKLTTAFIATQPIQLTLTPRQRQKTPAGGYAWVELQDRSPQTMRLVEPPNPPRPVRTADGIEREVEFLLIAEHDASLGVYDVFEHAGGRWEVIQLLHENGWERRAAVARHG